MLCLIPLSSSCDKAFAGKGGDVKMSVRVLIKIMIVVGFL